MKPGDSAKAPSPSEAGNPVASRCPAVTTGESGNAPQEPKSLDIIGATNIQVLADALLEDHKVWYRHDPSTVSWLLAELGSTYDYMREQAHRNNPMFRPIVFEQVERWSSSGDTRRLVLIAIHG